ncbi:MAG: hypothetical protein M1831_000464 [Alyxoria varia]|nr:MAG: hypothetical protein M1831_000464 [Alyxoria varia]
MATGENNASSFFSSIPDWLSQHTPDIPYANTVNHAVDQASTSVRDTLSAATWLPDFARPRPVPTTSRNTSTWAPAPPRGTFSSLKGWVDSHRAWSAAAVSFVGTGAYLLYHSRRRYARKRRARRTANGAKVEVVVVAGAANTPMTRALILDLERRGFIVYVVAATATEEDIVKSYGKPDIQPLHLDVTDPEDVRNTMTYFKELFDSSRHSHPSKTPRQLHFAGIVVLPDTVYPSGPLETISPDIWSDAINAKILGTIATMQAFLQAIVGHKARVTFLTPSIVSSLRPAFHGVESTVVGALEGFITSIRRELASVGVELCHIKFGNVNCDSTQERSGLQRNVGSEVLTWPTFARRAFASNFLAQMARRNGGILTGGEGRSQRSSMRYVNNAVFDSLTQRRPWTLQRVGQGSLMYALVGAMAPANLISWMTGIQSIPRVASREERGTLDSPGWEKV